jgi:hypothetical protein
MRSPTIKIMKCVSYYYNLRNPEPPPPPQLVHQKIFSYFDFRSLFLRQKFWASKHWLCGVLKLSQIYSFKQKVNTKTLPPHTVPSYWLHPCSTAPRSPCEPCISAHGPFPMDSIINETLPTVKHTVYLVLWQRVTHLVAPPCSSSVWESNLVSCPEAKLSTISWKSFQTKLLLPLTKA